VAGRERPEQLRDNGAGAARTIGRQSDLRVSWEITPHLLRLNEFGMFDTGSAICAADGRTAMFLDANPSLQVLG